MCKIMYIFLFLQQLSGKNKSEGMEDLIEKNFLVVPQTIASRKTSAAGDGSGRIRDHKLQVG